MGQFPLQSIDKILTTRRYRDDWATKHFLHAKTLRKAREVRTQLLDIMKHQKLDIIPCGTDWDVIRYAIKIAKYDFY